VTGYVAMNVSPATLVTAGCTRLLAGLPLPRILLELSEHDPVAVVVAPATTRDDLTRLGAALRELKAGIRVDELPEGLPFDTSAAALKGMTMLNLRSQFGDLDLTFSPAGFPAGYADLIGRAREHVVAGLTIRVAALRDVITSKATANRPKDQDALPELIRLARQAARGRDAGDSPAP